MYEILKILDEKRVTPTREMTLTLARCCHCGHEDVVTKQNVDRANRAGRKRCSKCVEDTFHHMTGTRFWSIWKGMKARATDPLSPDYHRYGGAGRGICSDWLDFKNFHRDMFEGYRNDLTIDRVDNTRGYSKDNCRWISIFEQQANKNNNRLVEYQGDRMHLAEFCRRAGVGRGAIVPRLDKGMSGDEAVADYTKSRYKRGRKSRTQTSTIL
jgi:hypothetical protein